MPLIATLTMNPSLDVTTTVDRVRPTDKLRTGPLRHDPGGGGINVARVIHELGGETIAIFPGGGPAVRMLDTLLVACGVPFRVVPIAQQTRESFTVDETGTGEQYRFVLPGPKLSEAEYGACLDALDALDPRPELVVLSGSLPTGTTPELPRSVCAFCARIGARLIVDMSGPLLREINCAYLMKPNLAELEELAGVPLADDAAIADAARMLIAAGKTQAVVVSMADRGALLVTADTQRLFPAIDVPVVSAVGAGDSMVGGIALGLIRGISLEDSVRQGMAAGAAALMSPGTELVRRADYDRLLAAYRG